ncbi:MAG TPA: FBP domain-containing protein [Rhodoglobus sp.]|nr:FBP domain-containing protein [Rhodoglobus sp.]
MKPLAPDDIRASFVNLGEADPDRIFVPALHEVIWDEREYFGWRDPQNRSRGYLVHWVGDRPVGLMLRVSPSAPPPGVAAMCSLCHTSRPSDQITMFSAPRAGEAGVNGNSIGTYICDDLACSHVVRHVPPGTAAKSSAEVLAERIVGLGTRLTAFTANVMKTA